MTAQIETQIKDRKHTRWQSIKRLLTAIDEGINYDPHEYANMTVRNLLQRVKQLEAKAAQIEGRKLQDEAEQGN